MTSDELKALLHYDPETGVFTWLQHRTRAGIGAVAGCDKGDGYWRISIKGKKIRSHHLAWLYMCGEWPADEVDHRDTVRSNNRWSNLRAATSTLNKENRRKASKSSKTGYLGVRQRTSGRYEAQIQASGKVQSLGTFDSPIEAHAAYLARKAVLHAGFASGLTNL